MVRVQHMYALNLSSEKGERDASTARVWTYGGYLKGSMSLRLQGVYLAACDGLSIYNIVQQVMYMGLSLARVCV